MVTKKKNMTLGDISMLSHSTQENLLKLYLDSLLYGELRDILDENKTKLFKGISRPFSKKYMLKFNEMLKHNKYTTGPLDVSFLVDIDGRDANEYYAFFVFQEGRGNAFGSFQTAYKYANETYLSKHMLLGDSSKQLAKNCKVAFGKVTIMGGKLVDKDLEEVVNNDFYDVLINS